MDSLTQRYWKYVIVKDGCWGWCGQRRRNGYGSLNVTRDGKRRNVAAHRISYELHNGPIPDGLWVLHKCDNPECSNPQHLFIGTRADNMKDAANKNRVTTIGKARMRSCLMGHAYSPDNVFIDYAGYRRCSKCFAAATQRRNLARRNKRESLKAALRKGEP